MNLLLFNLATDAEDTILAFATTWINQFARHYDAVDVITMRVGRLETAGNVRVFSVGKEKGYSEPKRAASFYAILSRLLRERHYDACFAHMMPLFAVMGAPLLGAYHVPVTIWYNHKSRHWTARYGRYIARRVVTSAPDSFPFLTPKLRVVGQAADTDFYTPSGSREGSTITYVARLSPIKHHETLLHALAELPGARAILVGGTPPGQDSAYETRLRDQAKALGLEDRVEFTGGQTPAGVRAAYGKAAVSVNLSPPGLFDKTALEAMACGVPTIVSNSGFGRALAGRADLLLIDNETDPRLLAAKLRSVLALPAEERERIGLSQRQAVIDHFSLHVLIPRLVSVINTGELPAETICDA